MAHEIKVGDVYQTKNGRTARIIATDKWGNDYPIVALVRDKNDDHETILAYTHDGRLACVHCDNNVDLVLPESYDDWEIDDPIWVWNDLSLVFQRHFAGIGPDGKVRAWHDGRTSHTIIEQELTSAWIFAAKTDPRESSRED
jgi:hypothetical protein